MKFDNLGNVSGFPLLPIVAAFLTDPMLIVYQQHATYRS